MANPRRAQETRGVHAVRQCDKVTTRRRRVSQALSRWFGVVFLSVMGAVAFEWILPSGWRLAQEMNDTFAWWFLGFSTVAVTSVLLCVLLEPISLRRAHLANMWWYPPTWVALVLAFLFVVILELLVPSLRHPGITPSWLRPEVLLAISVSIGGALLLRHMAWGRRTRQPDNGTESPPVATTLSPQRWTWNDTRDWLSGGERPIEHAASDFLGRVPLSERVAMRLTEGRCVALLGPLGSGKSSVLNLVRTLLRESELTAILADFDVWAVPRAEEVPRLALGRIVEALDNHVDTIALRDVPTTYQRLVAAAPVSNLSRALGIDTESDSTATLQRLNEILGALGARLVLIVEDAERTGKTFDTRHLQRLLWALREVPTISFVLAFDPSHGPRIDFAKLCDTVELLRPMDDRDVATVLLAAVDHWTSEYSDIDPRPDRRGKLQLSYVKEGALLEYVYRTNENRPLRHMARLLQTPRHLKRFVARVDSAWKQLHGEVDLEDLLIVTALREAATPAYDFLVSHIDAARCDPGANLFGPTSVEREWTACLESLGNRDSVRHLVSLLGITQLSNKQALIPPDRSPQGVYLSDPSDYFRRINAEQLDADELQDQAVLCDIKAWEHSRTESLIENLTARGGAEQGYATVWKHFGFRHTHQGLVQLTERTVRFLLETDGLMATMNHPALIALRRECHRQLLNEPNKHWLQGLTLEAVPVNLRFAVDFYDFLTGGELAIVPTAEREEIRCALMKAIQKAVRTDSDLVRHLTDKDPYRTSLIIKKTGPGEGIVPFETWGKHLAPILVDGAHNHPEDFLPELANLLATPGSHERAFGKEPPDFTNPYEIDRARADALLGEFLDNALAGLAHYEGTNPYAQRASDEAAKWLQERHDIASS